MPSLKRRAEESPPRGDKANTKLAEARPVSAFAAARQRTLETSSGYVDLAFKSVVVELKSEQPSASSSDYNPLEDANPTYELDKEHDSSEENPRVDAPLTTWKGNQTNILIDTYEELTIELRHRETIVNIGVYDIFIESGVVILNGAVLKAKNSPQRVFALCTHSLPVVEAIGSSVVRMRTCPSMKLLEQFSDLFTKIGAVAKNQDFRRSFTTAYRNVGDELKRSFIPVAALSPGLILKLCVIKSPKIMIAGTKHSGKNTYANCSINHMLTSMKDESEASVFFLDLDASKPEYTPQGQIALVEVRKLNFGPSYSHPAPIPDDGKDNHIIWSHCMPLNAIAEYPEYFFLCVSDLIKRYEALHSHHSKAILVINTPAWALSNDIDPFLRTISHIRPTSISYFYSGQREGRPDEQFLGPVRAACEKDGIEFSAIEAHPNAIPLRTDSRLASMHMLSYFHCEDLDEVTGQRIYNPTTLSRTSPWDVHYGPDPSDSLDFIGVLMLSEWTDASCIATILNGSLITIVETSDPAIQAQYGNLPCAPEDVTLRAHYGPASSIPARLAGIPYFPPDQNNVVTPLDPGTTKVVCTALIRGFDAHTRALEILVPSTHSALVAELDPQKTVLVFGCCDHPAWAYLEDTQFDQMARKKGVMGLNPDKDAAWRVGKSGIIMGPWVADAEEVEGWGKLHMLRKLRRFK
ncbi:hypothetical protein BU16DRAFT_613182 [Lophium mytilinum]|uniref:Polynucleotide 5'-hydroxyl-kinase GRC3 n=1 Tax=Lophium mytilinum TaxID=390894 RepID=A0A6A6R9D9_9PEZI|nr:hypothetical protein BU16DRAFT_613182 [Lophium mytilinum]